MIETGEATEARQGEGRTRRPPRPRFAPRQPLPELLHGRRHRVSGLFASARHAFDQRQFFVLLPYAAILGVLLSLRADAAPAPIALAAVGLPVAMLLWLARRTVLALRLTGLFAAFWVGFSLLAVQGALFGTPMLHGSAYGTFEARIDAVVDASAAGRRVIISAITAVPPTRPMRIRRARIVIRSGPPLGAGDIIAGSIYFYAVPGPALPDSFDAEFSSYFQGIGAYGSTTAVKLVSAGDPSSPGRLVENIRQTIGARIAAVLTQPSMGIAQAIITGDQTAVLDAPRKIMATAGLAHVLAISGLHLSIVAGSAFFVLRLIFALIGPLARRISVKKLAAAGAIFVALLYYAISGGGAASLRSTIMAVLIFVAVLFGRRAISMRNVAIAALFTILTAPADIFRPSFQLSFAAVVALVGIYEMLRMPRFAGRGVGGYVAAHFLGIVLTSVVAGVATLVFAIYHFQQTSPLSILGNLLVMPLVTLVMMPAAMLSVLAMPFGLEQPFIAIMGWSIDQMLSGAAIVARWSSAVDTPPLLTPLALFIALLGLCWFSFFTNRYRLLGPLLAAPFIMAFAIDRPPDVLISDTTQAIAMRGADGLALVSGKPKSFAVDLWGETYRQAIDKAPAAVTRCDSLGCVSRSSLGFTLALSKDPAAFAEDCATADLVVTHLYAPASCRSETTVLDAGNLAKGGAYWLSWNKTAGRFDIRPAFADLNRPWRAGR